MKIHSWIAAAAIAAAAAPLAAQDRQAPSAAAAATVTVVGCVERADQILSRETLGTTLGSLSFVLIKAEDGKASDQPQSAAPAGQPQAEGKTYRLDGDADTLNPHVGHRVEIKATRVQDAPVGTSGRADATASNPVAPPPVLKVESVKFVSSTCSR